MPVIPCQCGHQLSVDDVLVGQQVTCNQCNRVHLVGGAVAPAAVDPASYAPTVPEQPASYAPTVPEQPAAYAPGGVASHPGAYPPGGVAPQPGAYAPGGVAPQPAGYPSGGAAPQPSPYPQAGYDQPYAPPQAGGYPAPRQKSPSRWSLIVGGILAFITCLLWGAVGLVVLLSDEILPMKFSVMTSKQQLVYSLTVFGTILCGLCFVSASIGFAAKTWAAAFTAFVMLMLSAVNIYGLVDNYGMSRFGAFVFFAVPTFGALGFSAYGVLQARAIQAFRKAQASGHG